MNFPSWVQLVLTVSAVLIALHTIWNKAIVPVSNFVTLLVKVVPQLEELVEKFKPNGGHSLYDKIYQMAEDINDLTVSVAKLRQRVDKNVEDISDVREDVRYNPEDNTFTVPDRRDSEGKERRKDNNVTISSEHVEEKKEDEDG